MTETEKKEFISKHAKKLVVNLMPLVLGGMTEFCDDYTKETANTDMGSDFFEPFIVLFVSNLIGLIIEGCKLSGELTELRVLSLTKEIFKGIIMYCILQDVFSEKSLVGELEMLINLDDIKNARRN